MTGFSKGQTITIDTGANSETAVVSSVRRSGVTLTIAAPLTRAHAPGVLISGTGISLTTEARRTRG